MRDKRVRAGFTLVEIVVTLVIVAFLAGLVITQVTGRTVDGQAATLARSLDALAKAIVSFRNDVRRYPERLTHLATRPPTGAKDSCGGTIPTRFRDEWRGPYVERQVAGSGIPLAGGILVVDTLQRVPVPPDTLLRLRAREVDRAVAERLDAQLDGTASLTSGTIGWTEVGSTGRGTLTYDVPARGC